MEGEVHGSDPPTNNLSDVLRQKCESTSRFLSRYPGPLESEFRLKAFSSNSESCLRGKEKTETCLLKSHGFNEATHSTDDDDDHHHQEGLEKAYTSQWLVEDCFAVRQLPRRTSSLRTGCISYGTTRIFMACIHV